MGMAEQVAGKLEARRPGQVQAVGAVVPEAWVRTELARDPARPYPMDYIDALFTDFSEIHGDRAYGDDCAMTCGMARFHGDAVMVIGNLKGQDAEGAGFAAVRQPGARGVSQGAARDEAGGEVWKAGVYVSRSGWRFPRDWRGRAWTGRGDCKKSIRDVPVTRTDDCNDYRVKVARAARWPLLSRIVC